MTSQRKLNNRLRGLLSIAFSALVLCAIALANGQPFFCTDTTAYARGAEIGLTAMLGQRFSTDLLTGSRPLAREQAPSIASSAPSPSGYRESKPPGLTSIDDKIVLAGRSVYYGALLYVAYVTSDFWLAVVVQALAVAYVLHLLIVRMWGLGERALIGTVSTLVLVTPLGAFTGLLVPDIFAPLVILTMGTLGLYWRELGRADVVVLGLILFAGLISHPSHIALALVLWLMLAVGRRLKWHSSAHALMLFVACISGALAAEYAFNRVVTTVIGAPPLRLPYLTAHLVDAGPGTQFLRATCPASGYAACNYVQNYPTNWEKFMFSTDPTKGAFALASPNEKRRMSQEQIRFAYDVLRYDSLGVVHVLGTGAIEQVADFRAYLFHYGPDVLDSYKARLPPGVLARMEHNRISNSPAWSEAITVLTYVSVVIALVAGAILISGRRLDNLESTTRLRSFLVFVIAGVLANAFICGILASPNDRFQARVIWLVPFVAIVGWVSWRRTVGQHAMQTA